MVASVSVVTAHCVHFWVEGFFNQRQLLSVAFVATVFDQLTRFTVPLFFFLSGFGLTLQLQGKAIALRDYYRYRLTKILAPFLLWSLITSLRHEEFLLGLPWAADPGGAARTSLRFLFLDGFDYQYYFLIVIFQFYLVYPFIRNAARSAYFLGGILVFHLCLMSPMETYLELLGLRLPRIHPNLLMFHLLYCSAGIYAAWNKDFLSSLLRRWGGRKIAFFWTGTVALMVLEFVGNIWNEKALFDIDHFNRWSVVLYCFASLLLFLRFKNVIAERIYPRPLGKFLFGQVAPFTFFVYLAHTHVLRAVDYLLWEITVFDLINRVILVVAGSYFLAWTAQWLLEDFPRVRFLLGLPKKPMVDWSQVPGARLFRLHLSRPDRGLVRAGNGEHMANQASAEKRAGGR